MGRDDIAETLIGLAVVVAAVWFFAFAAQKGGAVATPGGGYALNAAFPRTDGVAPGTEVRLSGVKVGAVTGVSLLADRNYWVKVDFTVRSDVKIPADSTARIVSDGLLGGAHLALEAGGAEDSLGPGAEVVNTEGSQDLVSLLAALIEQGQTQPKQGAAPNGP